jgi:C1A family cysteine protease
MKKIIGLFVCMLMIAGGISVNANLINWNDNKDPNSCSEDLPESFDLRDVDGENYVTGIRDQQYPQYGTCWIHPVYAAMESNLLITGNWENAGEQGEPDLSESHMDWWNGFNTYNNDDAPGSTGLTVHWGGDCRVASAYLTRVEGAIREIDAPYDEISNPPERTNPDYHYYYVNDIEWYDIGDNLENMDLIKSKIMNYGAISIGFCDYDQFLDIMNYTYYQPPTSPIEITHNVAIIGWDNNKITQAPEKGAWLCKNSFGTGWGLDGYFWISYYDKHCCHYDAREWTASFQGVEPMPYNQIYYHDYHGWQDTLNESTEAFNAFYSASNNTLQAVSFFTATDNVDYIVRIYDTFESGELKGEFSNVSGTIPHMGFHTVDLDQPASLHPDDNFYIYLKLSNGGQPYDRTIEANEWWGGVRIESVSHPGESYYYDNGDWYDLYDFDNTANFCIKGLATGYVSPKLYITIKLGLGLGINVIYDNNGLGDAIGVPWEITVKGGILGLINETVNGTIDIPVGGTETVGTGMFFGFGPITITANIADEEKTATGTQFIIFSMVPK